MRTEKVESVGFELSSRKLYFFLSPQPTVVKMKEEAVAEDEDEYDDDERAAILKMELALLMEKARADLAEQEEVVAEDE